MQGKTIKCATKKDVNGKFVVDWKKPFPKGVSPQWLRKPHDNADEHRQSLFAATQEHEMKFSAGATQKRASAKTPAPAPPPQHPATIAAASVRTSSSTVSSLSQNALSAVSGHRLPPASTQNTTGRISTRVGFG